MTKNLNKADKTLALAATLFLFFLALNIQFKGNIFAEGLLFISEAALVGGIADWFAVTAIFKKPLGFPYHTALLPKRRKELIEATTIMVEQEFFSRKKIISHLKKFEVFSFVISLLKSDNVKVEILNTIAEKLNALKDDEKKIAINLLKDKSLQIILKMLSDLKKNGEDRELLKNAALYFDEKVKSDETREAIYNAFKKFEDKTVENELNFFLNIAAKSFGVVDLEEGTNIFQKKLSTFFEEVANNEKIQDNILNFIHEKADKFLTGEEFINQRNEFINSVFSALSMEKITEDILQKSIDNELQNSLIIEYDSMINLIENDGHIRNIFEHLIYDMVARSALYAQGKMGEIVNDAISALTDEELNRIVYEKVEDDLLWIRMNGSIVGSVVGTILFILLNYTKIVYSYL